MAAGRKLLRWNLHATCLYKTKSIRDLEDERSIFARFKIENPSVFWERGYRHAQKWTLDIAMGFVYFAVDGSNILWSVDGGAIQTGGALTSYKNASYKLEVGNYSGTGNATKIWNGSIDELSYWSDLLTQSEVESLWNSGNGVSFPHSSETTLVVSDPQHTHTSDTFAITQASDIVLADSQHAQTSDSVVLDTEVNLVAADSSHLHTAAHVPSEGGDGSLCMMHRNCILIG